MRFRLFAVIVALALLSGAFAAPVASSPRPRSHTPWIIASATPTIAHSYTITPFATLPGVSCFSVRQSPNGSISYAWEVGPSLYYTWSGSATPPGLLSSTAYCDREDLDIAFKPNGAAVVAWVDQRNAWYSPRDGSLQGVQLFVAASDTGWVNVLAETASTLRVTSFRVAVDSRGVIDVAYIRDTLDSFPYDYAVFAASSPTWTETNVSTDTAGQTLGAQSLDMALDSRDHIHVVWYYWGPPETVWYATSASRWSNVRVDTNQTANWWDKRYSPVLAVDASNAAHVVWVDNRLNDPNGTSQPNHMALFAASSANGFVNAPLVFPGNAQYLAEPSDPAVLIDSAGTMHAIWTAQADSYNLYYANSTDWNYAVRITDHDAYVNPYGSLPERPVAVENGKVSVFFADSRTGTFEIWRKSNWGTGPDTTAPVVGPQSDRVLETNRTVSLTANRAWDDDRIASWNWSFAGPAPFTSSGYTASATFRLPGRYIVTLTVADPAGLTNSGTFNVTALTEGPLRHWARDQRLYATLSSGTVTLGPWHGYFPLVDTGAAQYAQVAKNGSVLSGLTPIAGTVSAVIFDASGNVYTAGFNAGIGQIQFMSLAPSGATIVPPTVVALNGVNPQHPALAFANGEVWMAWSDQRNNLVEIYLAGLTPSGSVVWGPARVSLTNATTWSPALALARNRLWIVYTPTDFPTMASVLNLTTMAWDLQDVPVPVGYLPTVAGLADGGIAAAWIGTNAVYVGFLAANGSARGPATRITFEDGQGYQNPALLADANGTVHVAWWEAGNLTLRYAQVFPNGTVSPVGGVSLAWSAAGGGFGSTESASVALGPDGYPRIAYTRGGLQTAVTDFAYYDPVPPVARISPPQPFFENRPAYLSGNASTDDEAMGTYHWDFSAGASQDGRFVAHRFASAGAFTVTLTVTDAAGNANSTSEQVNVLLAPTAALSVRPLAVLAGQPVVLDARNSTEPGGSIATYTWTVTGATPSTYSGWVVTVRFTAAGIQTVTLTVADPAGTTDSAYAVVTVWPVPAFVVIHHPSGFQVPVPSYWETHTDYKVGSETVPVVSLGPGLAGFRTNLLVTYVDDSAAQETDAYLASAVDGTIKSVQQHYTDAYLLGGLTDLTVSGHAAVAFTIAYSAHGIMQRAVIVVSSAHHRDWLILISVASGGFDQTSAVFDLIVAGFLITALTPLAIAGIVGGIVAAVAATVAFVVIGRRRKRALRPKPAPVPPPSHQAAFSPSFCVSCGAPMQPGQAFCGRCGAPAWTGSPASPDMPPGPRP